MRRLLVLLCAVVAIATVLSLPASAADLKFGGQAYTRYYSTDNMRDGNDDVDDNLNGFTTRMRLYFTARGSENLMAVFKSEIDDIWGSGRIGRVSTDGGSNARADGSAPVGSTDPTRYSDASANSGMEIKNMYIQFNMPNTPLTFMVGALPAKIGSGLVFNDDTNGIVAVGKFDPVKVALAYSRLQDNAEPTAITPAAFATSLQAVTPATPTDASDDWDLWAGQVSFSPMKELAFTLGGSWMNTAFEAGGDKNDLNLYNLVLDADFKTDLFSLYFTGGKNFGSVDDPAGGEADFKGWLISAGGAVNVNPVVVGLDFFYSSGSNNTDDIETYVTPGVDGRNTYYMDEVIFMGWFDDESATYPTFPNAGAFTNNLTTTGLTNTNNLKTLTNLWAIGAHVDYKPFDQTLLQVGGAYIGFVRDVASETANGLPASATNPALKEDDKVGTSLYIRMSQGIVDGLQLRAVFGYLFADDGFTPNKNDDDAYKFATGLQWDW